MIDVRVMSSGNMTTVQIRNAGLYQGKTLEELSIDLAVLKRLLNPLRRDVLSMSFSVRPAAVIVIFSGTEPIDMETLRKIAGDWYGPVSRIPS